MTLATNSQTTPNFTQIPYIFRSDISSCIAFTLVYCPLPLSPYLQIFVDFKMSLASAERERYARELSEYTMRQFSAARKRLGEAGAAKLPASHAALAGTLSDRGQQQPAPAPQPASVKT